MTQDMRGALRNLAPGFVTFFIKAADTERNVEIHDAFKLLAKEECANDYTAALDLLLRYYEEDAKFEALWEHHKLMQAELEEIKEELATLKAEPTEEKEEVKKAF